MSPKQQNSPSLLISFEYSDSMTDFLCVIYYEFVTLETVIIYQYMTTECDYPDHLPTNDSRNKDLMIKDYKVDTNKTQKENLLMIIEEVVDHHRFIYGIPQIDRFGTIVNREDWENILSKIRNKTSTTFNSSFIEFLRANGLNPQPHNADKGQWISRCVSGGNHPMMISVFTDEFGCGWCKKKGGQKELENWIKERIEKNT